MSTTTHPPTPNKRRVVGIHIDPTGPQLVVSVIRNDGGARYVSPTAASRVRLMRLLDQRATRITIRDGAR